MMRKVILGIKDVKAACFTNDPIFALTKGVGIRAFTDAVNNAEMPFKAHPGDYQLWLLAEFDVVSGQVFPLEGGPECIGDASQFLEV